MARVFRLAADSDDDTEEELEMVIEEKDYLDELFYGPDIDSVNLIQGESDILNVDLISMLQNSLSIDKAVTNEVEENDGESQPLLLAVHPIYLRRRKNTVDIQVMSQSEAPNSSVGSVFLSSLATPSNKTALCKAKNGKMESYGRLFYLPHPHPRFAGWIICIPCCVLYHKGLITLCEIQKYRKKSGGTTWITHHINTHDVNESNWAEKLKEYEGFELAEGLIIIRDTECNKLQCEYFILNNVAFKTSDSLSYRRLMNYKRQPMRIISSRRLPSFIGRFFLENQTKVKTILRTHTGMFFLSTDGWSAQNTDGYFAIATQWKHDHLNVLLRLLLHFEFFPGTHTAAAISDKLFSIIVFYDLVSRVPTITTDNGSNMVAVIPILNRKLMAYCHDNRLPFRPIKLIRRFAHTLHLSVDKASVEMNGLVTKVKNMIERVKYKKPLREKYEALAIEHYSNGVPRVPSLCVKTRWNSTYRMLSRTYNLINVFKGLQRDEAVGGLIADYVPTTSEWITIASYIIFLNQLQMLQMMFQDPLTPL